MATPIGFWIFTEDQYLFLQDYITALGIEENKFHHVGNYYYLAEGEIDFTSYDWEDFFMDNDFPGESMPGFSEFLWSQTPWRVS
jgi:hypothetical protein